MRPLVIRLFCHITLQGRTGEIWKQITELNAWFQTRRIFS
jgi:hypothetical protein